MIVADTCVVVWLSLEPAVLSPAAAEAIAAAETAGELAISGITLFELAWLIRHQRISVHMTTQAYFNLVEARFRVLPLSPEIARLAVELPDSYPSDPMDRLIGATALAHAASLVTRDKLIRKSGALSVIW